MALSKLHEPALSNIILLPLYTYFLFTTFTALVAPNKVFLKFKLNSTSLVFLLIAVAIAKILVSNIFFST